MQWKVYGVLAGYVGKGTKVQGDEFQFQIKFDKNNGYMFIFISMSKKTQYFNVLDYWPTGRGIDPAPEA